jgi:hypothetical protein
MELLHSLIEWTLVPLKAKRETKNIQKNETIFEIISKKSDIKKMAGPPQVRWHSLKVVCAVVPYLSLAVLLQNKLNDEPWGSHF